MWAVVVGHEPVVSHQPIAGVAARNFPDLTPSGGYRTRKCAAPRPIFGNSEKMGRPSEAGVPQVVEVQVRPADLVSGFVPVTLEIPRGNGGPSGCAESPRFWLWTDELLQVFLNGRQDVRRQRPSSAPASVLGPTTGRPLRRHPQACSIRIVPWSRSTWHLWSASISPRRIWHHAASNTPTGADRACSPATRSTSATDATGRSSSADRPSPLDGAWALSRMSIGDGCVYDSPEEAVSNRRLLLDGPWRGGGTHGCRQVRGSGQFLAAQYRQDVPPGRFRRTSPSSFSRRSGLPSSHRVAYASSVSLPDFEWPKHHGSGQPVREPTTRWLRLGGEHVRSVVPSPSEECPRLPPSGGASPYVAKRRLAHGLPFSDHLAQIYPSGVTVTGRSGFWGGLATKLTDEGFLMVRREHFPALAWLFPTGGAGPAPVRWRRGRLGPALDPGHRDD